MDQIRMNNKMKIHHEVALLAIIVLFGIAHASKSDSPLNARDILNTIAPTYKKVRLPPGFPTLSEIKTDKFDYSTTTDKIRVSAALAKPIVLFPDYITISNIKMNFTFDKKDQKNRAWNARVKGSLAIGSTILHVNLFPNGHIKAFEESLELHDICSEFLKQEDKKKDIGIDVSAFTLENVTLHGKLLRNMNGMELTFTGTLKLNGMEPMIVKINVNKYENSKIQFFSVLEFSNSKPEKVIKKLLNQKVLNIPFLAHLMSDSDLFNTKQDYFGLSFAYNEVFYYNENTVTGSIIKSVLQSHIPEGISIHFPIKISKKSTSETVKIAFVINKPAFDLLIDQEDKLSVKEVLSVLSNEFVTIPKKNIPKFVTELDDAFTSHISFDSDSNMFSIFVRLHEYIDLVPRVLKIKVTNLVLQRKVGTDNSKEKWKVSAKGVYKIGDTKILVQYSELTDEKFKPYGLTGYGKNLKLQDIIDEYDPEFYPDEISEKMIENTEIENLTIHSLRLFSRVPKAGGTPHILITGYTNLPAWEKDIQIALLIIYNQNKWQVKWAASFKHSPLSNIIQALTGFDSRDIKLLHNSHIMTTIISSPLPSYSMLPQHIITTPLLRLPVKKAITIIALLRFPDNCGDDKMCASAAKILDKSKIYTAKGVLSMNEFPLTARVPYDVTLPNHLVTVNNTLLLTIGNNSHLDIKSTLQIPNSNLVFEGLIHIGKTGKISLDMYNRQKRWTTPFNFQTLSFEKLRLQETFSNETDVKNIFMKGVIRLGAQGGQAELETPVNLYYHPTNKFYSSFNANFTDVNLNELLAAFTIDIALPDILLESRFPSGLMLTYNGKGQANATYELRGEINIFGRLLNCNVIIIHPGKLKIITENSPAPAIFAKGQIIIQQDAKTKLRGPKIIANIDHLTADVVAKGFVKVLGIESDVTIALHNKDIRFSVAGKLMEYKETKLSAYSTGSTDSFQVFGCLGDVAFQVQLLLLEIIDRSANQSIVNMEKAEENYLNAQKYYEFAEEEELNIRNQRDRARAFYEGQLIDYGRFEVKANYSCIAPKCGFKCFGCPRLNKCCRLDIFGHCIACSEWKSCCWKNVNPLCIAKYDGCHVIRTIAEKELAEREAQIMQQKIILDNLDQHVTKSEVNKGKHKAVLEAAIDAKQVVAEDSSAGLNAHDAIKNFGSPYGWAKINSVCYNASMEQAATGCMNFQIASELFNNPEKNITIWSCLKEDLVTELTESLANYIFPNIIDTSTDSVTEVATNLNSAQSGAEIENGQASVNPENQPCQDCQTGQLQHDDQGKMKPPNAIVNDDGSNIQIHEPPQIVLGGKIGDSIQINEVQQGNTTFPGNDEEPVEENILIPNNPIIGIPLVNKPLSETPIQQGNTTLSGNDAEPVEEDTLIPNNPILGIPLVNKPLSEMTIQDIPIFGDPTNATIENNDPDSSADEENIPAIDPNDDAESDEGMLPNIIYPNGTKGTKLIDASHMPQQKIRVSGAKPPTIQIISVEKVEGFNEFSGSGSGSGSGESPGSALSPIDKELKTLFETEVKLGKRKPTLSENKNTTDSSKSKASSKQQNDTENETAIAEHIVETEIDENGKPNVENDHSNTTKDDGEITGSNKYFTKGAFGDSGAVQEVKQTIPNIVYPDFDPKQAIYYGTSQYPSFKHHKKLQWKSDRQVVGFNPHKNMYMPPGFSYDLVDKKKKKKKKGKKSHKKQHRHRNRYRREENTESPNTAHNKLNESTGKETKQKIQYPNYLPKEDEFPNFKHQRTSLKKDWKQEEELAQLGSHEAIMKTPGFSKNIGFTKSKKKKHHLHRDRRNLRDILFQDEIINPSLENSNSLKMSAPFWEVKRDQIPKSSVRSSLTLRPSQQRLMSGMIRKRWKIPGNANGRCHIFHQLISICRDMAETIVMLHKSLKTARVKFNEEDKETYMELFETDEFLLNAAKKVNVSGAVIGQADKTLNVVRQGVNIWSKRCSNEFDWQNQSGVQTWLQAMDLRIQELGGFGVYRFLENLFHAFEALFEVLTYSDSKTAKNALVMLQRIRKISTDFDKVFKNKLSVTNSRSYADHILTELKFLKKDSIFC